MAKLVGIPQVNFATARQAVEVAARANVPVLLLGDPGVGKTALASLVAASLELPLEVLLGSTLDPTDVGGLPVVRLDGNGVDRVPLALIQRCCKEPCVLLIDEVSTAAPSVQATLLRVILERVAGDSSLHPDTRIIAAANPPEQAPGGLELSAPFMGRVCALWLTPSVDEVCDYFLMLGEEGSKLREQAVDFALTARAIESKLLQIQIPQEAVSGNRPWGAPRSWERAIKARAAAAEANVTDANILDAVVAGSVGEECAAAYRALLRLRGQLPTVAEIVEHPDKAKLPDDRHLQLAALGLLGAIADRNIWAAWIYASRFCQEYGIAGLKMLSNRKYDGESASMLLPYSKQGALVRAEMVLKLYAGR